MEDRMIRQVETSGFAELSLDQLEIVSAGSPNSDYVSMMQLLSNCLRMLHDTQKAIVSNVR
jgi:hypothetical protein